MLDRQWPAAPDTVTLVNSALLVSEFQYGGSNAEYFNLDLLSLFVIQLVWKHISLSCALRETTLSDHFPSSGSPSVEAHSFRPPDVNIWLLPRLCPFGPSISVSCLSSLHSLTFLLFSFCSFRQFFSLGPHCWESPGQLTQDQCSVHYATMHQRSEVYFFQEVNLCEQFWMVVFLQCHPNQRIEKCQWLGSTVVGCTGFPGGVQFQPTPYFRSVSSHIPGFIFSWLLRYLSP